MPPSSPSHLPDTAATEGRKTSKYLRRLPWLITAGALLLAVGAVVGPIATRYAATVNVASAPLPRVFLNAPFIKTPDLIVDKMVELGQVTEADLVYDLGCGDGRLVIGAAVARGCRGVGFDIEPERIADAKMKAQELGVDQRVSFYQKDIFSVDLLEADVVLVYLLPWMMEKLVPQFEKCKPGTRIVSHDFTISGFEVDKTITLPVDNDGEHYIYLYVTPLKKLAL